MIRSQFLKRMAFAALTSGFLSGRRLPELVESDIIERTIDPMRNTITYQHMSYGVGFTVTKEFIEDSQLLHMSDAERWNALSKSLRAE